MAVTEEDNCWAPECQPRYLLTPQHTLNQVQWIPLHRLVLDHYGTKTVFTFSWHYNKESGAYSWDINTLSNDWWKQNTWALYLWASFLSHQIQKIVLVFRSSNQKQRNNNKKSKQIIIYSSSLYACMHKYMKTHFLRINWVLYFITIIYM